MSDWGKSKGTLCLWYDKAVHGGAEAAAQFYASLFPDTAVGHVMRSPGDYPGARRAMRWWWNSRCWALPASA
jgi:2-polyprenyl-6-hydroxyphenyl methylase/3-demethylubiquinone-9 3-methyltransferase